MSHIDDADRERSPGRREVVCEEKMPKSDPARSISSKRTVLPGLGAWERFCPWDIHAELEELIKASTEDSDSEESKNTRDTKAKKYKSRQGQFSPLYEPEIWNENEGRRKCRTRRNRRVPKPEE